MKRAEPDGDLLAKLEKRESTSDLAAFAESRREDKRGGVCMMLHTKVATER